MHVAFKYGFKVRFVLAITITVLTAFVAIGQQIKVSGGVPDTPGELVRVMSYEDLFSRWEKTLATTRTDQEGYFQLDFNLAHATFAYIAVGLKRGELHLSNEPGSFYDLTIKPDTNSQRGSIFDELPLQFIVTAKDGGLLDAIGEFNTQYNTFLYKNANRIYRGRDRTFINEFRKNIDNQFDKYESDYLKEYIRYSFASLEWTSKMKSNDSIVSEYFINKPVLYNNIQYCEFLTDFFKTYFIIENVFEYHELIEAINGESDGLSVKSLILRNEVFQQDPQISELIETILIAKKYYNPDIRRSKVLNLLKEIQHNGLYEENRLVAENYIKKLLDLESGTIAPSFSLADKNGTLFSLSDFQGKFVLLSFVKPSCKICLNHLGLLVELKERFPAKLQNVTIVYGQDYKDVITYASERDFNWPILNLDDDILMLEAFNIRAYPSYVLLNPDGTISMATAPMPDENLELYISRQISRFEKRQAENK